MVTSRLQRLVCLFTGTNQTHTKPLRSTRYGALAILTQIVALRDLIYLYLALYEEIKHFVLEIVTINICIPFFYSLYHLELFILFQYAKKKLKAKKLQFVFFYRLQTSSFLIAFIGLLNYISTSAFSQVDLHVRFDYQSILKQT